MTSPRKPVEVEAAGLDEAGHGVGVVDGRTLHVANLAPGERAVIQLEHQSPHRPEAWGRVVKRLGELSADRTTPACPASGKCGGCGWQHLTYDAQLVHKRARVVEALGAAGVLAGVEVAAPVPSPSQLGYRHKGKYVVGARPGRLVLGAWGPRRGTLVETAGCRVVAPVIDELREAVRLAAERAGLDAWDERARTGALRYVIVRATRAGQVLVVLVVRADADEARVLAVARAVAEDARVAGVVRIDNDRDDGGLLDGAGRALVGEAVVRDVIAGVEIELGAGEFAQINPAQADAMYARVAALAAVEAGEQVADVYAGVGGISFALARGGASVVAIERDAGAVAALRAAAARAGLGERIDARTGDATMVKDLHEVAVVVVNPPRKGLAAEVVDAIAAGTAKRMIYVSCGPESLGRDLTRLVAAGFRVEVVEPFDLMPGTGQIETVVRLVR